MPDLKLNSEREQPAAGRAGPARGRAGRSLHDVGGSRGRVLIPARAAASAVSLRALWRDHRLFTILALLSLLPRILATISFRPALLTADSFLYMKDAVNSTLGVIRPSGYSFFLRVLEPFHSLLLVTTIQHLMGIAIAVIVYGLLRYHGLPGWGAALAAAPTLFDTRQIALESYILPDTVYCLVIMLAVAVLLTRRTPRPWQCVAAGLLLAYASVLRGNGLPLVFVALAFMLARRVGWRALADPPREHERQRHEHQRQAVPAQQSRRRSCCRSARAGRRRSRCREARPGPCRPCWPRRRQRTICGHPMPGGAMTRIRVSTATTTSSAGSSRSMRSGLSPLTTFGSAPGTWRWYSPRRTGRSVMRR